LTKKGDTIHKFYKHGVCRKWLIMKLNEDEPAAHIVRLEMEHVASLQIAEVEAIGYRKIITSTNTVIDEMPTLSPVDTDSPTESPKLMNLALDGEAEQIK